MKLNNTCLFSTNESLIEDIDSYIYSNQYNMNTADLVLCALCNALMVTAVIYEVRESSVITLSHEPGRPGIESRGKIFLHCMALELAPTTML